MPFLKSFVWFDLELNPGLSNHWWTLYPLGHVLIQADSVVQVRTHLLTANFGSSAQGERHNSYYADHTIWPHQRAAYLAIFKISVSRDPKKKPNYIFNGPISTSTQSQRTQFSDYMVQCQPSIVVTFKILKFSANLFWAWRHPRASPFPVGGLLW